jgi:RNA polymerase sigma factor (sigma-70 family)
MGGARDETPRDAYLLAGLGRGEPEALGRLMDRYDRLVRYTIYRISRERCGRDPLWLDSVASEVWLDVTRSARAQPDLAVANVPSYLIQIARRRCIDAIRRRGEAPEATGGSEDLTASQIPANKEDTSETLSRFEQLSAVRECLGRLNEDDRALCSELSAITAGRWREAAGRLGMPESTLRSRWKRVLDRLRAGLEEAGLG